MFKQIQQKSLGIMQWFQQLSYRERKSGQLKFLRIQIDNF